MAEPGSRRDFRSGDAMVAFGADMRIVQWNRALEELTGIPSSEAVGHRCWEVLGGLDERGAVICHAGCSHARLAREGWPVSSQELSVKTGGGRRLVSTSTIALYNGEAPVFLHLLRDGLEEPDLRPPAGPAEAPALTSRQREVLELMAEGAPAKRIGSRLGISETTVRNHIHAILLELGCHSQLEAVAKARRDGLV